MKMTPIPESSPTPKSSVWSIYDTDPDHPWNRVFRRLYRRVAADGREYGWAELDPLLWFDTDYLLEGDSHQEALKVLDEFLSSHAENRVMDPLKRAMFQRDLWAVFDWLASQSDSFPAERRALQARLVQIMRRVALPKEEILALPQNALLTIAAREYPDVYMPDQPDAVFLPADLFQPESAWVPMGREGGPIAIIHTQNEPFFGHSVFLVFVRAPASREASLDFIQSLNAEPAPETAPGTEVALVRRMLLIDDRGELVLSPLIESVQLRHFSPQQHFYEFELDRARLLRGEGGLISKNELIPTFMSHGDVFENPDFPQMTAGIPDLCRACHTEDPLAINAGNTRSILSYSRDKFALPDQARPVLHPTTWEDEARSVIEWKHSHKTWELLANVWEQTYP
jgi:hypothetical protein